MMQLSPDTLAIILVGLGILVIVAVALLLQISAKQRAAAQGKPVPASRQVNLKQLEAMPATEAVTRMQKELRSWGITLMILGGLHLITSGLLNSQWGLVLLIVGSMSFIFN